MDVIDLKSLDWTTLKMLHEKNVAILHTKLLSGADWAEVSVVGDFVTQIEIAMDNSMPPVNHPEKDKA